MKIRIKQEDLMSKHLSWLAEFYWFAAYFIIDIQSWSGLKNGMLYFKDFKMVDLFEQLELVIERKNKEDNIWRRANATDIETDIKLLKEVQELYNQYKAIVQRTIKKMNNMIINNMDEYLMIEQES